MTRINTINKQEGIINGVFLFIYMGCFLAYGGGLATVSTSLLNKDIRL